MARQNFVGFVVSQGKMNKTVKVRIETKVFNKRINKILLHRKDYLVHDEKEISREGDLVRIESTKPLSKRKYFAIAEILKNKGQQFAKFEENAKFLVNEEETKKLKEFNERQQLNNNDTDSFLSDIKTIQKYLNDQNSIPNDTIDNIKKKYNITEFTKRTANELLNLDVMDLEETVNRQRDSINYVTDTVKELIIDEDKSNAFLLNHGVENPHSLKRNIKKNIIRKFALKDLEKDTNKFSQNVDTLL